jgi:hypothetical protein
MSKEMYIAIHEELIEKYMEQHPAATDSQAYDATAQAAYDGMGDRMADMVDDARMRAKDRA